MRNLKVRIYYKNDAIIPFSLPGGGVRYKKDYFYVDYYINTFKFKDFDSWTAIEGFLNLKVFIN